MSEAYKTLYKLNTDGSTQVWSVHFDDKGYWSVASKLGGKEIVSAPTIVTPKGKRTLEEQILSEVESKIKKKMDKKYVENVDDIKKADGNLDGYTAMLAQSYAKHKHKIKFPCVAQPKLDGIRNNSTPDGMFSRGRKRFTSCPHIQAELNDFYAKHPEARLDGEFYTHTYKEDFEKICKAVKRTAEHSTPEDVKFQEKIEYWVYDSPRLNGFVESDTFKKRQTEVAKLLKDYKYIKVVPTVYDVKDEAELIALKEKWVEDGYEGAMARNEDSAYEEKRSYNLQKLKDFVDAEFKIIRVNEGNGKLLGHAGSFTFEMKDGKRFDAKLTGSTGRLKHLFMHQGLCIGVMGTVRYQNLSADGIPRFPVCVAVRDYE